MSNVSGQVPDAGTPIFNAQGYIDPVWHQFFYMLLRRTGGTVGTDPTDQINRIIDLEIRATEAELQEYSQVFKKDIEQDQQPQLIPVQPITEERQEDFVYTHGMLNDPGLHTVVTTTANGFMSSADKVKLNGVTAGAAVASVSGTAPIVSSGGTTPAISITAATTVAAGSMSAADKTKLNGIGTGAAVVSVAGTAPIASSGGANPTISIAQVTTTTDGSMIAADKVKLNGITAGAAVSAVTGTAPIASSGGTSPAISITPATTSAAGSMSAVDKTRIDGLSVTSSPTFKALSTTDGQYEFPFVQVPSANPNCLDDYEEGPCTLNITFATPGNLSVAYTLQQAVYTKIGRLVTVNFVLQTSTFTHTTASGNLTITGLPFPMSGIIECHGKMTWQGITKPPFTEVSAVVSSGSSSMIAVACASNAIRSAVTAADMPTGGFVFFAGTIQYIA